jgi:hypothetical protein
MFFKPNSITAMVEDRKDNTRRVWKRGEYATDSLGHEVVTSTGHRVNDNRILTVYTAGGRVKWRVGRTYAVSPGRGRPTIYMMPDQHERMVPVEPDKLMWDGDHTAWDIANSEVFLSDGKPHRNAWMANNGLRPLRIRLLEIRYEPLHDISAEDAIAEGIDEDVCLIHNGASPEALDRIARKIAIDRYRVLWDTINTRTGTRWIDSPRVWVLRFAVVRDGD